MGFSSGMPKDFKRKGENKRGGGGGGGGIVSCCVHCKNRFGLKELRNMEAKLLASICSDLSEVFPQRHAN